MPAVVTLSEPSAFTLVTVRPVRTLVEAVVPVDEPIENTPPDNSETPSEVNCANDEPDP